MRRRVLEPDVGADERFRLDRRTDLLQRGCVSDRDLRVGSAQGVSRAGRDEDDELRAVLRESHAHAESVEGRPRQPLTRTRVDQAEVILATDRKYSPVGAVRKAPAPVRQRVADLLEGSGVEEHEARVSKDRQRLRVWADRN